MARYAPVQQAMTGSIPLEAVFDNKNALLVKQTARGCCQECMGCEAKSEYKISAMDFGYMRSGGWLNEGAMTQQDEMYALEESSFLMRCCWRDGRAMEVHVTQGAEEGGPEIVSYEKPCGCPLNCSIPLEDGSIDIPCCCMLPELTTLKDGDEISTSRYLCDVYCCVSKFSYEEDGDQVYILKPDTCCGGCLPACKCKRQISVPYYFYDPTTGERITDGQDDEENQPQIRKVWAGMKKECCTTADTFAVFFPQGADVKRKAGILGLTFLLDFTVFERQGQDAA
uniref:Phospholipid scramblase n=1 Tax=Pyrodinium bahamense TaxID=73915 RepID=A0A7S0FDM4_9DINO